MSAAVEFHRRIEHRLMAALAGGVLVIVVLLAALGAVARSIGEPGLLGELRHNAALVAEKLQHQIDRAFEVGIPLENMSGLRESLSVELQRYPELAFLALRDGQGRVLERVARSGLEAEADQALAGRGGRYWTGEVLLGERGNGARVVVGVPNDHFDRMLRDMILELASAVVVAVVLASELVQFVLSYFALGTLLRLQWSLHGIALGRLDRRCALEAGRQGMGARAAQRLDRCLDEIAARAAALGAAGGAALQRWRGAHLPSGVLQPAGNVVGVTRLGIFFIALSEELCRPFFAVFAAGIAEGGWLSPAVLTGLPIGAFMLAWALAQPLGPVLLPRLGVRRGLLLGAVAAAAGLLLTATASDPYALTAYRLLTGLGYGLFLIIGQAAIVQEAREESRARDLAAVAAAIVAAGICGPMIGGAVADRLGFAAAFVACALCALAGGAVGWFGLRAGAASGSPFDWRVIGRIFAVGRFARLVLLSAVPAKFAATAILVVLIPLYLHELGSSKTVIGRVLMLYFLAFVLVAPLAARLADGGLRRALVVAGGAVSGLAVLLPALVAEAWAAALGCALFGACQALISGPQLSWISAVVRQERPDMPVEAGLGVFRLLERLGSVVAPLVCGAVAASLGLGAALGLLGAALVLAAAGLLLASKNENGV